jgi:hypothetical protein
MRNSPLVSEDIALESRETIEVEIYMGMGTITWAWIVVWKRHLWRGGGPTACGHLSSKDLTNVMPKWSTSVVDVGKFVRYLKKHVKWLMLHCMHACGEATVMRKGGMACVRI